MVGSKPSGCLLLRLRMMARRATRHYDRHLAPSGLGIGQFWLLGMLWSMDGASVTDLAARLELERTTLTRNLRPLQRKNLVSLGAGADRRTRSVHITAAGKAAVLAGQPLWAAAQAELADTLGRAEFDALYGALDRALAKVGHPVA
jgi:DNA-binding MarR family transcriptional regulator